ncbi:MAG: alpha/beta fold hydrolase [Jatrophihabitans sp.]|uniref:alpha/beta fold hydrolase n=1 Tax=Jatrophihabitans sp. TaxID=1932789 RepID=UPI00390D243C
MPTVDLPQGRVNYSVAGPADSEEPPVVFIHGLLVNGELWSRPAEDLGGQGIRSYAPDLPLGSHRIALGEDADLSPRGVARLILDFLDALDLTDVTLVGNDTGGALCQFLIDTDSTRIGRLVLTNCDAFDKFPPPPFGAIVALGRRPWRLRMFLRSAGPKFVRHSILGYGGLVATPLDAELSARWVRPAIEDRGVAKDTARFLRAIDKRELADVATRLGDFDKPVLLVWGEADRFFKIEFAERLQQAFGDARLVRIPGGRTFVPYDSPDRLADEIRALSRQPA